VNSLALLRPTDIVNPKWQPMFSAHEPPGGLINVIAQYINRCEERNPLKRNLFTALAALPVAVVLGAGIAHADAQQAAQVRSLLAADYLPPLESVAPTGAPRDTDTEAHRICAGLAQTVAAHLPTLPGMPGGGSAVYTEAYQVSLNMVGNDSDVSVITMAQAEQLVRDTASVYCPQYKNS
jgi:hypothetical protein